MNIYGKYNKRKTTSYKEKIFNLVSNNLISQKEANNLLLKHRIELIKKRKYKKGKPITSFEELLSKDMVYMYGSPKSRGFVYSQQFYSLLNLLKRGDICEVEIFTQKEKDLEIEFLKKEIKK